MDCLFGEDHVRAIFVELIELCKFKKIFLHTNRSRTMKIALIMHTACTAYVLVTGRRISEFIIQQIHVARATIFRRIGLMLEVNYKLMWL